MSGSFAVRRTAALFVSLLIAALLAAVPSSARASTTYSLLFSTSSDRSAPVALGGATVAGSIYVFTSPETGATQVRFYIDDVGMTKAPYKTENRAPWDLAGTASSGAANPYATTSLSDGSHSVTAAIDLSAGGTTVITATFTVANGSAPPPPPPPPPTGTSADQIHLAWVESPSTTLTVVWRTPTTATSVEVEYRKTGTTTWSKATGALRTSGTAGSLREVTIRGLTANTSYEYRVAKDGGGWSSVMSTRTAPAAGPADFEAIYVADTGIVGRTDGLTTGTQQVIDEIAKLKPLVVLGGGDYAYYNTDKRWPTLDGAIDAWFDQMQPVISTAPFMPAYGNHETSATLHEAYEPWAQRFPTPTGHGGGDKRQNYSFRIGSVHFVSINASSDQGGLSRSHLSWIENEIIAAKNGGATWVVPYFHVAPFSNGSVHGSNLTLRRQVGPIFERQGVKVVLTSHDQSFERTFPLTGIPSKIKATSTSTSCYTAADGVTWVKVSPGGKLSTTNGAFSSWKTEPPPYPTAARDNTKHHFARIIASSNGDLRVMTYGVTGTGATPTVVDDFRYTTGSC